MRWKPLIYKGIDLSEQYLISDSGEIFSLKTSKVLKQNILKTGYYAVCVSVGSRKNKKLIKSHIAVAYNFCDGYKDGLIVNHKDGNKLNNNYDNLEWVTYRENSNHALEHGLCYKNGSLKFSKVMCINTGEIFESGSSAAKKYNLKSPSNIFDVCNGRKKYAGVGENGIRLEWKYA